MNDKNIKPNTLTEGSAVSAPELAQLQTPIRDMQMELDILKETIHVLKKDPGIVRTAPKNKEKAVIVDALKNQYSLPALLKRLEFLKSSYYYQEAAMKRSDKYDDARCMIHQLFHENKQRRKYSSYQGEISPSVPNRIERDFHADKPNQKWRTDITEFVLT